MIKNLEIYCCNAIQSDHPLNNKPGRMCTYYKHILSLSIRNIQKLPECINFELKIDGKLCNFLSLYKYTSQIQEDFETFSKKLEVNLENLLQRRRL